MLAHHEGKPGDKPLLGAVVFTLALAAAVIFGVHQAAIPENSGNPKINPVKIHELINSGKLSGRPAEHFEVIPSQ